MVVCGRHCIIGHARYLIFDENRGNHKIFQPCARIALHIQFHWTTARLFIWWVACNSLLVTVGWNLERQDLITFYFDGSLSCLEIRLKAIEVSRRPFMGGGYAGFTKPKFPKKLFKLWIAKSPNLSAILCDLLSKTANLSLFEITNCSFKYWFLIYAF